MKRALIWTTAIVVALAVAIILAFRLSPWPSVALIEYAFSKGDAATESSLAKHVPNDISAQIDIAYGDDKAERLDVFRRHDTAARLPAIVWIHGGAWIAGTKETVANYLKILAAHGYVTVGVEYSTGFGSTYPRPVEQVNLALAYLVRHAGEFAIDTNRIILAGDSAGAQIAAQTALIITDPAYAGKIGITPGLPAGQLRAILLLSGAYNVDAVDFNGSFGWFVRTVLWAYSGVRDFARDERFRLLSVTNYVSERFPRSFISSGNGDPLAPQAVALADKLERQGVVVDSLFFPADRNPPLPHEYQFDLDNAAGRQALERMLAFVRASVSDR
jgi:acetyl esterase